jgi:hypothetical protein
MAKQRKSSKPGKAASKNTALKKIAPTAAALKGKGASATPSALSGWQQIAAYLGHPAAVVQRWAAEGMPVRRQGRFVTTTPEELNAWLGRESGKPVHVATEETDLAAELKRGLSFVRSERAAKDKKG